jgi:hypothetical protein
MNLQPILNKYIEKCFTGSDINELLPYIKDVASMCEHCTEMGVRNPTSTYAILASNPKKLISYDIGRYPEVDEVEALAKEAGIDFEFILKDVLQADIEETDFLIIDTFHTKTQLERELERHSSKVKKYILLHDTTSFEFSGEQPYEGIPSEVACGQGLWPAVTDFLAKGEWQIKYRYVHNNGLTILERI